MAVDVRIVIDDRNVMSRLLGTMDRKVRWMAHQVEQSAVRALSVPQAVRVTGSGRVVGTDPSKGGEAPRMATRELRASIRARVGRSGMEITATIGSNVDYARALEMGTNRMAARPFMRPALTRMWREIARGFSGA